MKMSKKQDAISYYLDISNIVSEMVSSMVMRIKQLNSLQKQQNDLLI